MAVGFVLYFLCPLAWLKLTGRNAGDYGLRVDHAPRLATWFMAGAPVALLAAYIASRDPAIAAYYPIEPAARAGGSAFAEYLAGALVYLFAWEFVFRGYLTFTLYRRFGWWGVVLEAAIFGLAHWGKPPMEAASAFFGSAAQGVIALRTRSMLVPYLLHSLLFVALNGLVTVPLLVRFGNQIALACQHFSVRVLALGGGG